MPTERQMETYTQEEQTLVRMLAMENNFEVGQWASTHVREVLWLGNSTNRGNNQFLNSLWRSFLRYNRLTPRQTQVLQERMGLVPSTVSTNPPPQPATITDALQIPNGTFRVSCTNSTYIDETYQIYTVTRGTLEGKRIVKRKVGGTYRGFGFVMNDGTFKIWRRFEEEADAPWVKAAAGLVAWFATCDPEGTFLPHDRNEILIDIGLPRDSFGQSRVALVTPAYACRICNQATFGAAQSPYMLHHSRCVETARVIANNGVFERSIHQEMPRSDRVRTQPTALDESRLPRSAFNSGMIL